MSSLSLLVLSLLAASVFCASVEYSYDDQDAWDDIDNSQCGGNMQSPINVVTDDLENGDEIDLSDLVFSYLDENLQGTWTNNGHSLQFTPAAASDARTVRTYRGTYELLQFHFHWGANDDEGSEHRINGNQYSGELHFVHQTTATDASGTDFDYYTVVGVLLEADDDLSAEDTIWESFSDIPGFEEVYNISDSDTDYGDLLPTDREYYYYNGSLTTPLCNQIVQWVLLQNPVAVPSSFFTAARTLQQEDGAILTANFRNAQALNGRTVYDSAPDDARIILPTISVIVFSIFAATFSLY